MSILQKAFFKSKVHIATDSAIVLQVGGKFRVFHHTFNYSSFKDVREAQLQIQMNQLEHATYNIWLSKSSQVEHHAKKNPVKQRQSEVQLADVFNNEIQFYLLTITCIYITGAPE